MEQLKYSLGPFELFAAIIGGSPFVLAIFLLHTPVASVADFGALVQTIGASGGAVAIALTLIFLSYIIGGTIQGLSWKYFLRLCKLFKLEYMYFGTQLTDRERALQGLSPDQPQVLEFEDRLVLQLREKIGFPKKLEWLDSRLKAYLRERNSPSVAAADTYMASHIMYRNLSLGCLLLGIVNLINAVRLGAIAPVFIGLLIGYLAYLMFRRSVNFKKWNNRTLVLGFYFSATKDPGTEEPR